MIDFPAFRKKIADQNVTLVAVSKTRTHKQLMHLYDQGQRVFGENRVAELVEKQEALPKDISWHMIGHLQSKKVKKIISFVDLIHAVDSVKLLEVIQKEAEKHQKQQAVLLQMKVAQEESKYGMIEEEILAILADYQSGNYPNVLISGLMGMASFVSDQEQIKHEFQSLKSTFDICQSKLEDEEFNILSMGMSGDYELAIEQGSNMVRIGSLLF